MNQDWVNKLIFRSQELLLFSHCSSLHDDTCFWQTCYWFQRSLPLFPFSRQSLVCRFCAISAFSITLVSAVLTLPSRSYVLQVAAVDIHINSKCPDLCQHFSLFIQPFHREDLLLSDRGNQDTNLFPLGNWNQSSWAVRLPIFCVNGFLKSLRCREYMLSDQFLYL